METSASSKTLHNVSENAVSFNIVNFLILPLDIETISSETKLSFETAVFDDKYVPKDCSIADRSAFCVADSFYLPFALTFKVAIFSFSCAHISKFCKIKNENNSNFL